MRIPTATGPMSPVLVLFTLPKERVEFLSLCFFAQTVKREDGQPCLVG
jgi:hypothetical protein